ncbi:hypothetical protein AB0M32_51395 [Streptomyces sp. NPDC051985]|uniref:hypothetical protein n=1 Tax=Streptomyces sp. NPDC051985 TaxID=3155807 RepID=UPI00343BC9B1
MTAPEPKTPVDRTTPVGAAVIALHRQLTDLEERRGDWPGSDVVGILDEWLEQFDFTAPAADVAHIPPRPPGQAWVLRRWDRHGDGITLFADEDCALAELARHARGHWENLLGDDTAPGEPPADDRAAVDLYYGPDRDNRPDEGYLLGAAAISGRGRPRIVPLVFQFPDAAACESASQAVLLDALLSATDAVRIPKESIVVAALAAGVLWRCPACRWDNPAAATCCEGPGPCRTPQSVGGVETGREP